MHSQFSQSFDPKMPLRERTVQPVMFLFFTFPPTDNIICALQWAAVQLPGEITSEAQMSTKARWRAVFCVVVVFKKSKRAVFFMNF